MAYPNQKDWAWYLVGEKNELEKSLSRKIARFRRNSRVIPGFFSFLINKVGPGHLLKFFTKDVSPQVWRAAFSGSLWAWMVWSGLAGLTAETVLLGHTARLSETLHNCMYTLKRETLGSNLYDNSAITRTETDWRQNAYGRQLLAWLSVARPRSRMNVVVSQMLSQNISTLIKLYLACSQPILTILTVFQ